MGTRFMPVFNALLNPEVSVEYLVVRIPAFAFQEMAGFGLYWGRHTEDAPIKDKS